MHKLQIIYLLFCSSSTQFAPGVNSLLCIFEEVAAGGWWMTEQLVGAVDYVTY